jgi:hypothetical protein
LASVTAKIAPHITVGFDRSAQSPEMTNASVGLVQPDARVRGKSIADTDQLDALKVLAEARLDG